MGSTGYDYGNARLRAMKSRLLTRHELAELAESSSMEGLITALANTTYRQAVQAALVRMSGIACVAEALKLDLVDTLGRIHSFYSGRESDLVAIALPSYDSDNLKTILRGLSRKATPSEISRALLPVGELTDAILAELVHASDTRTAIDLLASMGLSIAHPLLILRAERPGADTPEMELALDRWCFQETRRRIRKSPISTGLISAALDLETDIANLLTVMRFAHDPAEHQMLRKWLSVDDIRCLFLGPGRLSFELLAHAGDQNTPEAAVETLKHTPYEPPLQAGLEAYMQSGRLSDFERQLDRFRLRWMAPLIGKDPLGIGVVLGYRALKINEVVNIRRIAHGLQLRLQPEAIKMDLEYA
ncbi:MAG: hypothetical protein E3J37_05955 [Anaerolineales bacterium]|nr:MAG: hypothetical protein E3J37_05955 [Anaerolineales bacterium]